MTNPNPITKDARRQAFLAALAQTGVISAAAKAAGVDRVTAYRWREADPEFAEACESALEEAADAIELEARRRAVEGIEEPVLHQGAPTYLYQLDETGHPVMDENGKPKLLLDEQGRPRVLTIKRYSDSLMALVLKGNKPDKYREKQDINLTGQIEVASAIIAARKRSGG